MKSRNWLYGLLLIFIALSSCEEPGNGRLIIKMIDSPGDYEAVYVDVQEVKIKYSEEDGWKSLTTNTGVYDLLTLTGGAEVVLVDEEVMSGKISELRMVLGESNSVIVNGVEETLKTPSAQTSGLKIKINQTLDPEFDHTIVLDFDAARSVVKAGNKYNLKPVIRAVVEATTGIVMGKVNPAEENVGVYAKFNNVALATTYAPADSEDFMLKGLDPGTYSITLDPGDESLYQSLTIDNVTVQAGESVDLGTLTLELK